MQAKSGGSGRASALSRGAEARAAYAARAGGDGGREAKAKAVPDSRENSPRGGSGGGGSGSGSPIEGSPRSPTGAAAPVGLSSPERMRRQRRRSEAAQIALFEAMAPGGGAEPHVGADRARAKTVGGLPLFNKEHQVLHAHAHVNVHVPMSTS